MLPQLAAYYQQEPLDCIYSSDLQRARRTAEAIAAAKGMEVGEGSD